MMDLPVLISVSSLILLRIIIGFYPHSGEGNDHDFKAAYGGDYEAQRHWMEVTLHVDIGDWYYYDLSYWGLDYPPLTAYISYICGYFSHYLVGPETVALLDSRGFEDSLHKSYMRGTVLVLDVLVYFSAVFMVAKTLSSRFDKRRREAHLWTVIIALAQPSIILIDHGHFQYNTTALGLSLWSFYFMTKRGNDCFINCVIGAIFYCMALNFKQMTLYYAPAVFFYLLGRCIEINPASKGTVAIDVFIKRFLMLGVTVISCFVILWWPFWVFAKKDVKPIDSILQVLNRQFPFQRGLFEGKVSNIWCTLSTKPFSIRQRLPASILPLLALLLTVALLIPCCYSLFSAVSSFQMQTKKDCKQLEEGRDLRLLLLGSSSSALSFFLASFQVHEKSILLALSPLSLMFLEYPYFVSWFSIVATWTMWPLMQVDNLHFAYFICIAIFSCLLSVFKTDEIFCKYSSSLTATWDQVHQIIQSYVIPVSISLMVILHILEVFVLPPDNLPDIFAVLWSIVGCLFFCLSLIYCTIHLFSS